MPLSANDFLHGVDFTGINPINAGDLNNVVDLATPYSDNATQGKGIVLWTVDTALGIPSVPNIIITPKWKRYIWIRIPFVGAIDPTPLIYGWNDNAIADVVFSKWIQLIPNVGQFQAQIDAINAQLNALQATVQGAITAANAASVTANLADTTANNALTDANNAQATATTANINAANAVSTANQAQTTANNALTAANANVAIGKIVPGAAGQKIRTKADASALEYYDEGKNYVRVSESQLVGTGGGNSINGTVTRTINTIDFDPGNNCSIGGNKITIKTAGTWKVFGICPGNAAAGSHNQAYLMDDVSNTKMIRGTSEASIPVGGPTKSFLVGFVTLVANQVIRIDHKFDTGTVDGLGKACSLDTEVYTILELWRIA